MELNEVNIRKNTNVTIMRFLYANFRSATSSLTRSVVVSHDFMFLYLKYVRDYTVSSPKIRQLLILYNVSTPTHFFYKKPFYKKLVLEIKNFKKFSSTISNHPD